MAEEIKTETPKSEELLPQDIKVEVVGDSETTSDIQNYLQSFNKEIQIVPDNQTNAQENPAGSESGENSYFITEEGQCFFKSGSTAIPVTVVGEAGKEGPDAKKEDSSDPVATEQQQVTPQQSGTTMLLGETAFQTVTIVPSESSNGEVSYVLIVQNPNEDQDKGKEVQEQSDSGEQEGGENDEEHDLTVYDFDDGDNANTTDSGDEELKKKLIKLVQTRKSQVATQSYMCNYCNYTTPKRYLLARHMKSHSEERPHKCSVCERGFKTLVSLQNHVNTHTGTKPHGCSYCDSCFTTAGELIRHVRYKHTHEKPHKCSVCDYASVELSKMRNHMRCHTGERPYQCPHCTYASPDSFKLKRHLRIHTGERPYKCDICGHCFTQSNSLKAHRLIHQAEGEKPAFQCEFCPATCGRKTDLRIHIQKLHSSDRIITCKRCGKQFPDRYSFKVHNKTHEGEKCFKCDLCPYASVSQRHLETHMFMHTDQKPFVCRECDQRFRQKQLLRRHQNLYHNPSYIPPQPKEKTHECSECKKAFRHKGNLIRHMSFHDPDSQAQQRATALKLGRQKRVQLVNAAVIETKDETEDEDDVGMIGDSSVATDKSLVSVGPDDLVFLQVVDVDDERDEDIKNERGKSRGTESEPQIEEIISPDIEPKCKNTTISKGSIQDKDILDLEDCFGFGESDEEQEETQQ